MKSNVPRQLAYGAMVFVRKSIVTEASNYLSRAVTIAVRYSAVRRQFGTEEGKPETQVIFWLCICYINQYRKEAFIFYYYYFLNFFVT